MLSASLAKIIVHSGIVSAGRSRTSYINRGTDLLHSLSQRAVNLRKSLSNFLFLIDKPRTQSSQERTYTTTHVDLYQCLRLSFYQHYQNHILLDRDEMEVRTASKTRTVFHYRRKYQLLSEHLSFLLHISSEFVAKTDGVSIDLTDVSRKSNG